jgi:uncharacterized protein (TIGR03000 family)
MIRSNWKRMLFGVVVATMLLGAVERADAWWWGCCQPVYYGCSPCWSVCDPCCGGGWYLGYRPGPIRRLLLGPCRWYYAGGWCGSCCYSSCYTTYTCCDEVPTCCGATVSQPTPATKAIPTPAQKPVIEAPAAPTPAAPMPAEPGTMPAPAVPSEPTTPTPGMVPEVPTIPTEPTSTNSPTPENSGVITVWVPYDAKVTINGLVTRSTGSRRQFVSYGLKSGFSYKYEIRAEVLRDGKSVQDTRTVTLIAGQSTSVAFGFNINPVEGLASAN